MQQQIMGAHMNWSILSHNHLGLGLILYSKRYQMLPGPSEGEKLTSFPSHLCEKRPELAVALNEDVFEHHSAHNYMSKTFGAAFASKVTYPQVVYINRPKLTYTNLGCYYSKSGSRCIIAQES